MKKVNIIFVILLLFVQVGCKEQVNGSDKTTNKSSGEKIRVIVDEKSKQDIEEDLEQKHVVDKLLERDSETVEELVNQKVNISLLRPMRISSMLPREVIITLINIYSRIMIPEHGRILALWYVDNVLNKNYERANKHMKGLLEDEDINRPYIDYAKCIESDICAMTVRGENDFAKTKIKITSPGVYKLVRSAVNVENSDCKEDVELAFCITNSDVQKKCFKSEFEIIHKYSFDHKYQILIPYYFNYKKYNGKNENLLCKGDRSGDGEYEIRLLKRNSAGEFKPEEDALPNRLIVNHSLSYWGPTSSKYDRFLIGSKFSKKLSSLAILYDPIHYFVDTSIEDSKRHVKMFYNEYAMVSRNDNESNLFKKLRKRRDNMTFFIKRNFEKKCYGRQINRDEIYFVSHLASRSHLQSILNANCEEGIILFKEILSILRGEVGGEYRKDVNEYIELYSDDSNYINVMNALAVISEATDQELQVLFSKKNKELKKEFGAIELLYGHLSLGLGIINERPKLHAELREKLKEIVSSNEVTYSFDSFKVGEKRLYLFQSDKEQRAEIKEKLYQRLRETISLISPDSDIDIENKKLIEVFYEDVVGKYFLSQIIKKYYFELNDACEKINKGTIKKEYLVGIEKTLKKYENKTVEVIPQNNEEKKKLIETFREDMRKLVSYVFPLDILESRGYTDFFFKVVSSSKVNPREISEEDFLLAFGKIFGSFFSNYSPLRDYRFLINKQILKIKNGEKID